MFEKDHCSPSKHERIISCIPNNLLHKIYTILYKSDPPPSKEKIYTLISDKLSGKCKGEICWTKVVEIEKGLTPREYDILLDSFRPLMPKDWGSGKSSWLNNTNIDDVMNQYSEKFSRFKYCGANPIDYNVIAGEKCVNEYLCKLNVSNTMKDYDKLGIVFNTDPHDKSGQHWFTVLVDFKGEYDKKTPCIFIYDSVGIQSKLPPTIVELVNDISVQFARLNDKPMDLIYNDIEHQRGNTECGVFCLYFLTHLLENNSLQDYLLLKPSDEDMKQYRNYFYIK